MDGHAVTLNNPGWESVSAGLGSIEQYSIILIVLIIIGIILLIKWMKGRRIVN